MNTKIFILLGLVAIAAADKRPSESYGPPESAEEEESAEYSPAAEEEEEFDAPKYDFGFEVKDGYADFEHQEEREDENTQGSYSVQLPDGRLQKVTYYIDGDSGYVAEVTYEGEAEFPESSEYSRPRPAYSESEDSSQEPSYSAQESDESEEEEDEEKPSYNPPQRKYGVPEK